MKKTLIGSCVGGIVFYIWGFVSNMVLLLGSIGVDMLPNEDAVMASLNEVSEPGYYLFPGTDNLDMDSPEYAAWMEKYRAGPVGVVILNPEGVEPISAGQLAIQLVTSLACCLLVGFVLARTTGSYVIRVLQVTSFGIFAWILVNVSYWNWYSFPALFTIGRGIEDVIGWTIVGLVMAKLIKPV